MLFDLSKKTDQDRLKAFMIKAVKSEVLIEAKTKREATLKTNSYFHLIVSYFALCYGETLEYVKVEFVKKKICEEIFATERVNEKRGGEMRPALRSWADLDQEEQSLVISRFKDWSAKEMKIRLPEPEDKLYIREIQVELDRNKQYL
jgi:hypothetical protein